MFIWESTVFGKVNLSQKFENLRPLERVSEVKVR